MLWVLWIVKLPIEWQVGDKLLTAVRIDTLEGLLTEVFWDCLGLGCLCPSTIGWRARWDFNFSLSGYNLRCSAWGCQCRRFDHRLTSWVLECGQVKTDHQVSYVRTRRVFCQLFWRYNCCRFVFVQRNHANSLGTDCSKVLTAWSCLEGYSWPHKLGYYHPLSCCFPMDIFVPWILKRLFNKCYFRQWISKPYLINPCHWKFLPVLGSGLIKYTLWRWLQFRLQRS